MRIGLTYNVKPDEATGSDDLYAEYDSMETILAIRSAIESYGNDVLLIEVNLDAYEVLRKEKPDMVYNFGEGVFGEMRESQIPLFCEMLGIPCTGSGPLAMGLCLDKSRTKEILSYHQIPNPCFQVFRTGLECLDSSLKFPLIVKPVSEGSSKGIKNDSLVNDESQLRKQISIVLKDYKQPVLVEEFLPGREFTVGILGNKTLVLLPILEKNFSVLPPDANQIDSFEAKWIWDDPKNPVEMLIVPKLSDSLQKEIKNVVSESFNCLGCRDWARIDLRLDSKGQVKVIEINPIPGLLPQLEENSCLPRAAHEFGLSFEELVNAPLYFALKRYNLDISSDFDELAHKLKT